ncbi:MAG: AmmeMemoRadiSam system protein B [Rhodospirillaceae bacterium]|jgi:MEMO1 family protein|nr:AmmeMemoRadiSam system protein B [Rhodospirillaceae bacterium]MBT5244205.1 AmmeMemoRadiSam system protein B [Rhodospirillaceae bacterium]MBT5561730.1 AmmeMemoRadiSam system protein B [Rhodospirillaceae bacterium]MBT6243169.1 AmmeMemoRadiSam system protein B [Rhodospirillaceae bacterium]MBT7137438.1 AmmeMemoRadiSam system protein B [Rhodospirillaceae bacterium]
MGSIRPPAVAGTFYSGSSEQLGADVAGFLAAAETGTAVPKAIIVPHAGFIYSGSTAASAFVLLKAAAATIRRVVLLGPCHRVPLSGLALSSAEAFSTPLGNVAIDSEAARAIANLPQVQVFDETHAQEHSLEVQLPFLQAVLEDFKVLPLVVGDANPDMVAEILDALWGGPETLIVISSDLSHFLDYERARSLDASTSRAIENLDPAAIGDDQACGRNPVKGLLALAKRRGLKVETLGLCNSGDTAGTKDRVVGYGAWAFYEGDKSEDFEARTRTLLDEHGVTLLALASDSINHGLADGTPAPINLVDFPAAITAPGASFVTLKKNGQLRGCIGSAQAHRPLVTDVTDNAFASAFRDHRFSPLMVDELVGLELSISVLSPSSPMSITSEKDLLKQLRPQIDGLIIEDKGMRALFLPSVWRQLPQPEQFLGHLKAKAGMARGHWSPTFKAWRFIAAEISA